MNSYNDFIFSSVSELDMARYRKTIKKHKWTWDFTKRKSIYHSPEEILSDPRYIDELWYENNGKFRKHVIVLDKQQDALKIDFIKRNIVALLTIKLPSKSYNGFTRSRKESTAREKYRIIIREILRFMSGCSHFEKDPPFDFVCVIEHGEKNFWHCHIGIIPLININTDLFMFKLRDACDKTIFKYGFGKKVIDLEWVYDKEGVCTYLVKEFQKEDRNYRKEKQLPMYYTLYSMFHVGKQRKLAKLINMIRIACLRKKKGSLHIPNPIDKLFKRLTHKGSYRRKLEINSTTNLCP